MSATAPTAATTGAPAAYSGYGYGGYTGGYGYGGYGGASYTAAPVATYGATPVERQVFTEAVTIPTQQTVMVPQTTYQARTIQVPSPSGCNHCRNAVSIRFFLQRCGRPRDRAD